MLPFSADECNPLNMTSLNMNMTSLNMNMTSFFVQLYQISYTLNAVIGPVTCVVLAAIVSWITEELIILEENVDSFQETNLDTLHVDSSQETKLDALNVDSLQVSKLDTSDSVILGNDIQSLDLVLFIRSCDLGKDIADLIYLVSNSQRLTASLFQLHLVLLIRSHSLNHQI
ncbi:hypothetical protein Anas_12059 [Armadillidium nasatum]|uniref:Uncharacterized protein n=1 Tax=Armadillidium nasatum TaxID=96803 RepID=A0A5N5TA19_9CRUS|nr:hypothetical protein Anas_12059 [Armadillidium nasatum]